MVKTMNNNIDINIKSIEAFKNISDESIANIKANSILYNYKIGQPICKENIIPK